VVHLQPQAGALAINAGQFCLARQREERVQAAVSLSAFQFLSDPRACAAAVFDIQKPVLANPAAGILAFARGGPGVQWALVAQVLDAPGEALYCALSCRWLCIYVRSCQCIGVLLCL
jgi:hypothetical protein